MEFSHKDAVFFAAAALAAISLFLLFLPFAGSAGEKKKAGILLALLRAGAMALLLIVLGGMHFKKKARPDRCPELVLLADISRSMADDKELLGPVLENIQAWAGRHQVVLRTYAIGLEIRPVKHPAEVLRLAEAAVHVDSLATGPPKLPASRLQT
ncbi:MAG: hypothetical protein HY747_11815 [Elusimicrobia bacterium]|nr:hypothetical protein [Elusimicrobiota bacterium]